MKICRVKYCDRKSSSTEGLCRGHLFQLQKYGRVKDWTLKRLNQYINCGDYFKIVLRNIEQDIVGYSLIDRLDFKKISKFKWGLKNDPENDLCYAVKFSHPRRLHRLIMGDKEGKVIDHINHNGLDNRRSNLRWVTQSQNLMSRRGLQINNKSGIAGVHYDRNREKWMAFIKIRTKRIGLGRYDTKEEAIKVRLKAEQKYFGEFAYQL